MNNRAHSRTYYLKNQERLKAYNRNYYWENREKILKAKRSGTLRKRLSKLPPWKRILTLITNLWRK